MVPTMLFQQQQKLSNKAKKASRRRSRTSTSSEKSDNRSNHSSSVAVESSLPIFESNALIPKSTAKTSNFEPHVVDAKTSQNNHDYNENLADTFTNHSAEAGSGVTGNVSIPGPLSHHINESQEIHAPSGLINATFTKYPDVHPKNQLSQAHRSDEHSREFFGISQFRPFTDLSSLNTFEGIQGILINPSYALKKFHIFLDMFSEHHINDPINFAMVRMQSLRSFTDRQSSSKLNIFDESSLHQDRSPILYENALSFELLKCRSYLRSLINTELQKQGRCSFISNEELIQYNFINYVRFLINLPVPGDEDFNAEPPLRTHYEFRAFLHKVNLILDSITKKNYDKELSQSSHSVDSLIQNITKSSYEFILLENYIIQILVKFNNDFLIERRITKHLYNLYNLNMKLGKKEALKVMVFNTWFSVNYSWHLAVTIPFVRVFEMGIINEPVSILENDDLPHEINSLKPGCLALDDMDHPLYDEYFSKLDLSSFDNFCQMTRNSLATFHKKEAMANSAQKTCVKPKNFEFYSQSLATIALETFHVIQSRDFALHVTPDLSKTILKQFYRLLRYGGVLELPLFVTGDDRHSALGSEIQHLFANPTQAHQSSKSNLIPKFVRNILSHLSDIFGPENVKFSSVLLTNKNEMSKYLIEHTTMVLYEMFGRLDEYCEQHRVREGDKRELFFYYYIRAEKV